MVLQFSTQNYLSIRDLQTLHLEAAPLKSPSEDLDQNICVHPETGLKLLKSKAIYGANASGKSNVVRAIQAMFHIMQNSLKDDEVLEKMVDPFRLDKELEGTPTFFEVVFLMNGTRYRYGFEATKRKVVSEWLFGKPSEQEEAAVRGRYLFLREGRELKINLERFREGRRLYQEKEIIPLFRDDSLVLSTCAALNGPICTTIMTYLSKIVILSGIDSVQAIEYSLDRFDRDPVFRQWVEGLLKGLDPTIHSLKEVEIELHLSGSDKEITDAEAVSKVRKLNHIGIQRQVKHSLPEDRLTSFFLGFHEAEGTKKLFGLSGFIFNVLEVGAAMVIDEFDARMHPNLTRKIVEIFHDPATNPHGAQLIFVTHDSNLLDPRLLRRDQIAFASKGADGATELYSLAEFRGVRNNAPFEKDYLAGKYKAVPTNLNMLSSVIQSYLADEQVH